MSKGEGSKSPPFNPGFALNHPVRYEVKFALRYHKEVDSRISTYNQSIAIFMPTTQYIACAWVLVEISRFNHRPMSMPMNHDRCAGLLELLSHALVDYIHIDRPLALRVAFAELA